MLRIMGILIFCICFSDGQTQALELSGNNNLDDIFKKCSRFSKQNMHDSSLLYSRFALNEASRVKDEKGVAIAYYYIGAAFTQLNIYDSARYYLSEAMEKAKAGKLHRLSVQCNNSFAIYFNFLSDNSQSIQHLLTCITIIRESKDKELYSYLPTIFSNIGYIFDSEKQYTRSFIYHQKAYENKIYSSDTSQLVMIYQNFFLAHLRNRNLDVSKKYLDSSNFFNKNQRSTIREVYIRNNYGLFYETSGLHEKALTSYISAYKLCDSLGAKYFLSTVAVNIAKSYFRNGHEQKAIRYAKEAFNNAINLINYADAVAAATLIADIKKKTGRYQEALFYMEASAQYTDSLNVQEIRKSILLLETKYQAGIREKELLELRMTNAANELKVKNRNRLLLLTLISAGAIILAFGLYYRNSQNKQKLAKAEKKIQQQQISFLEQQQQVISMQAMINGQESERTRIAKDLHDGLGGLFSTVKMHLSTLQHEQTILKTDPLFTRSYEMVNTASEEVRRIAHNMMPEVLLKMGVVQATQELCNRISAGKLLHVSLQAYGMEKRLNASTEIMLFRIIQELLNNIIKHSQANEAIVQFNREGNRLSVTVEDNGRGFNMKESDEKISAGLSSVKSRVQYLNGQLSIDSQNEIGTTVLMNFLINDQSAGS